MGTSVATVVLVGLFIWWWSRPPQMGNDEEVAKAVDALFTAVTARDEKLLGNCERRLLALKDAGKLPPEASTFLDNIISKARAGRWESAAQSLYDFVRAQRREGPHEPRRKEKSLSNTGKK
ncbi:MAG TPA: hypothetical protein VH682_10350 [Gemmataceae bacterium]